MRQDSFNLEVVRDIQDLARVGAEKFIKSATSALSSRSRFTVVLSGGITPQPLYERIATEGMKIGLPCGICQHHATI
jgi:6-phosphogluconolactonase/glucosamine-6-phosphate isomerase/deaminase